VSNAISGKPVIYQVFTRLFGNQNTTNKPWGTLAENGVGKFSDFNDIALRAIKSYGTTHLWYTGVPHHALIQHYDGISDDHPEVVKGRAGSPYAVKDYYNVNPDLADDPANRLAEFEALIERTHRHGMKVIIDIVPNHVARNYESVSAPDGVRDFGADDDTSVAYARDNDFYYIPGEDFHTPDYPAGFEPLGDSYQGPSFQESPAKWTGNGGRSAKPASDDWYETVKVNYGVKPDGSHDFPSLPDGYEQQDFVAHFEFWKDKTLPSSWIKFRDIALYWLDKGVDGFRFDMAEMVPVEFWSFMNSSIKMHTPSAEVIAEVYQPDLYRDYIFKGKMDYLYDKVDVYDTLKDIVQEKAGCSRLDADQQKLADIEPHLLRFLENHDEQRIAHPEFAGSAERGWPAMIVTALLGQGPTMLYFGQAQGEKAEFDVGFGKASRTTIFDYAGVPAHQAWMNGGHFDGGGLSASQAELDAAHQRLLKFSTTDASLHGTFTSLHTANLGTELGYRERQYSFVREHQGEWILVFVNFDFKDSFCTLTLPADIAAKLPGAEAGAMLHEKIGEEWVQKTFDQDAHGNLTLPINCPGFNGQVFKLAR
jgi:glycosidase